jgi:Protein of unknown function (DUF559)
MKKHPIDGARARARSLRQNMTEAERRVWQILRSHPAQLSGIVGGISTDCDGGGRPKKWRVTCRWFGEVAYVAA